MSFRKGLTIPVIEGSGGGNSGGLIQSIIGAILIAVSFIPGNPFPQATFAIGVSLLIGGIIQMLTPTPKINDSNDAEEEKTSFLFNGAVNVREQGHPVPAIYGGPYLVGSIIGSAGLRIEQM